MPETPASARLDRHILPRLPFPVPGPWLDRLLLLPRVQAVYSEARTRADSRPLFGPLLETLGVALHADPADLARIPPRGPVVVVANHPFGLLEGPLLGEFLLRVRPDVRFLANSLLGAIPELAGHVIPVNPFGGKQAAIENLKALRRCLEWLHAGGLLVVFPAGAVSSLQPRRFRVEDPAWKPAAARLILRTGAAAVPLFLHGANSAGFQSAGLVHPRLRTALLPREFVNKQGRTVRIAVGAPIPAAALAALPGEPEVTECLRRRVHALRWRSVPPASSAAPLIRRAAPLSAAVAPAALRAEIEALPAAGRLGESGGLAAFLASASEIPSVLREIGRLRELTFRLAGEGTGNPSDLDPFDEDYHHLFLWNSERSEIAGAYRLAETQPLLRRRGLPGLYTSTLFRFHPALFHRLGPAVELGRSFVRPEYQRHFHPLLLLWKGIGRYIAARPQCRYLFGPVSISAAYSRIAREIMAAYLAAHCREESLCPLVRPRKPFRPRLHLAGEVRRLASLLTTLDDLCSVVEDLEPGCRSIPVLLRQYLNLGGRFLGFNVDPGFSGVLDGLVLVDLLRTNPKALQRHLGREGAQRLLDFHASGGHNLLAS